jgi:hypothetical protein
MASDLMETRLSVMPPFHPTFLLFFQLAMINKQLVSLLLIEKTVT